MSFLYSLYSNSYFFSQKVSPLHLAMKRRLDENFSPTERDPITYWVRKTSQRNTVARSFHADAVASGEKGFLRP